MTDTLIMLLDRLHWPSCFVKERACRELASLLTQNSPNPVLDDALANWIVRQPLESTCVYGLLVLVKAKLDGARLDFERLGKLAIEMKAPSLLSVLLFEELGVAVNDETSGHSGEAPANFSPPKFFARYVESFLPPAVHDWAQRIEEIEHIPFIRQWSYEWQNLMEREGYAASTEAAEYWGGPSSDKQFAPADTRISEVYRSAFLRALAWASQCGRIKANTALYFASKICPVDLALWEIPVARAPAWWPIVQATTSPLDTTPAEVWLRVGLLWLKQGARQPWDSGPLGNDEVLLAAGGPVCIAPHSTELKILGAFQRCLGSKSPELSEAFEAVKLAPHNYAQLVQTQWNSRLRCTGKLTCGSEGGFAARVEDWGLVPATLSLHLPTVPRWQAWRMHHALRAPLPFVCGGSLTIEPAESCLHFAANPGQKASWHDWHRGIQEQSDRKQPEPAGYFLTAPRSWIEATEKRLGAQFIWLCELNAHYSKGWSDDAETVSDYRSFGASSIVLPG